MKRRQLFSFPLMLLMFLMVLIVTMFANCKSSPETKNEENKTEAAKRAIDDEFEISSGRTNTVGNSIAKGSELGKQIDGDISDWKAPKFKSFRSKEDIESGKELWDGPKDLSVEVAFESDKGWVYFFVRVTDETIIPGIDEQHVDGLRFTIADPSLSTLIGSAPETIFTVLADGRVLDKNGDMLSIVEAATDESEKGYVAEIAFPLEAFKTISKMPLSEFSFRIEVLDGDDKKHPDVQTIIATNIKKHRKRRRRVERPGIGRSFAKASISLFPTQPIVSAMPRRNALGIWNFDAGQWSFDSDEVVPKLWTPVLNLENFEKELRASKGFSSACNLARNEFNLIDAYTSSGGGFRAGLILCGTRSSRSKCAPNAKTHVRWIKMEKEGKYWRVDKTIEIFPKPLTQCVHQKSKSTLYSRFSFFPLDILGQSFWMVGWSANKEESDYRKNQNGVVFLNTTSDRSIIGSILTSEFEANAQESFDAVASTYLTKLDDDKYVDICQIESWEESNCEDYKKGCTQRERGIRFNIYMWDPDAAFFESFDLIKHKRCNQNYNLKNKKSYQILQTRERITLIPFPKSQ